MHEAEALEGPVHKAWGFNPRKIDQKEQVP